MKLEGIYIGPPHGYFKNGVAQKFNLERTNLGNRSMIVVDTPEKDMTVAIYNDVFEFLDCWAFVHKVKEKTDAPG